MKKERRVGTPDYEEMKRSLLAGDVPEIEESRAALYKVIKVQKVGGEEQIGWVLCVFL